jgi:Family of unknown function (DUF6502)
MTFKKNSASPRLGHAIPGAFREAETVARAVQDLLELLAPILLSCGITPLAIADLAKNALVVSAASSSKMSTGRVNQSKVAAVTGLSRAEVRRRLANSSRLPVPKSKALDRSARVVAGWIRDPLFLDRNGRPKILSLKRGASSFAELVRLHSGDIPPRVVLEQLKDREAVRVREGSISLRPKSKRQGPAAHNTLLDVFPYVSDLLSAAATNSARLAYAQRINMVVAGESQAILTTERVVRALAATAAALSSISTMNHEAESPIKRSKLTVALTLTSRPFSVERKKSARKLSL